MNEYLEEFLRIIEQYAEALEQAGKRRKITGGLFGFGNGPGDDPCHETMDKQVGELTVRIMTEDVLPEETVSVVSAILQAEKNQNWSESAKWAVIAIQRHTIPIIPKIEPEDRKKLAAWYLQAYPKRMRLPIQKQIIKELEK